MNTYIISLKSNLRRRRLQIRQMHAYNLNFEFIDAIHYADLDQEFFSKQADWTRPLPLKDYAVFLSHQIAWEKVSLQSAPCMIIEDDALISKFIKPPLEKISKIPPDCLTAFDLEYVPRKHILSRRKILLHDIYSSIKIYENKNGLGAYVITPAVARRLLDESKQFYLVDAFVWNRPWLETYQVEPALAVQEIYLEPDTLVMAEWNFNLQMEHIMPKSIIRSKIRSVLNEMRKVPKILAGRMFGTRRYIEFKPEHFQEL
jgi:GR25 family glycosyltransferase involved in LPS biosynthesis